MARKIIYKENGLTGTNNTPGGYKYLGYDGLVLSEKAGATISAIGGGDYLPLTGGSLSGALTIQGTALYDGFAGFELFSDEPRITLIDSSFTEYRFENGEITILGPLGDIMKMGVTSSNEYIKFDANTSTLQGSSGTNNTWTLPNATGTVALVTDITTAVTGATGEVAYFDSTSSIAGDSNYTFDPITQTLTVPNIVVGGTSTIVESTVVIINDPIFAIGGTQAPAANDHKNRGIQFAYHTGSTARIGYFGYDETKSRFKYIPDATNTSEIITGAVGDVEFNDGYFNEIHVTGTTGINFLAGLGVTESIKNNGGILEVRASKDVAIYTSNGDGWFDLKANGGLGLQDTASGNNIYIEPQNLNLNAQGPTHSGILDFRSDTLTATRTWDMPDASGTVALTQNQGYDNFIEVSISSAEILSLSTTPKDVLPVLTGSDYYDYKVIFEYTYGTTPYNSGGGGSFLIVDNLGRGLTTMENLNAVTYSFASNYYTYGSRVRPATGLSCSIVSPPTSGDGTVNLKVYYTTHTL